MNATICKGWKELNIKKKRSLLKVRKIVKDRNKF